jgi:hypothetical protein
MQVMLTFCLCLVFNAHPDFWLPNAAIDAKYSQLVVGTIKTAEEGIRSVKKDLAVDPKTQLEIELAKSQFELLKSLLEQLEAAKEYLIQERFDNRVRLLLNKPPRKGR